MQVGCSLNAKFGHAQDFQGFLGLWFRQHCFVESAADEETQVRMLSLDSYKAPDFTVPTVWFLYGFTKQRFIFLIWFKRKNFLAGKVLHNFGIKCPAWGMRHIYGWQVSEPEMKETGQAEKSPRPQGDAAAEIASSRAQSSRKTSQNRFLRGDHTDLYTVSSSCHPRMCMPTILCLMCVVVITTETVFTFAREKILIPMFVTVFISD